MDDNATPAHRANVTILGSIFELEGRQARAVREHLLGDKTALARLQALDDQIKTLRATLQQE